MMDAMTERQFDKIMKMVAMILDGCKDLDEAKEKSRRFWITTAIHRKSEVK